MTSKIDLVLRVVEDGFKGVHHRLDRMNNKIQKHEEGLIKQRIDIVKIKEKDKQPLRGGGFGGTVIRIIMKLF